MLDMAKVKLTRLDLEQGLKRPIMGTLDVELAERQLKLNQEAIDFAFKMFRDPKYITDQQWDRAMSGPFSEAEIN